MRKRTNIHLQGRRQRSPWTDALRASPSQTVSSPGSLGIFPGSGEGYPCSNSVPEGRDPCCASYDEEGNCLSAAGPGDTSECPDPVDTQMPFEADFGLTGTCRYFRWTKDWGYNNLFPETLDLVGTGQVVNYFTNSAVPDNARMVYAWSNEEQLFGGSVDEILDIETYSVVSFARPVGVNAVTLRATIFTANDETYGTPPQDYIYSIYSCNIGNLTPGLSITRGEWETCMGTAQEVYQGVHPGAAAEQQIEASWNLDQDAPYIQFFMKSTTSNFGTRFGGDLLERGVLTGNDGSQWSVNISAHNVGAPLVDGDESDDYLLDLYNTSCGCSQVSTGPGYYFDTLIKKDAYWLPSSPDVSYYKQVYFNGLPVSVGTHYWLDGLKVHPMDPAIFDDTTATAEVVVN